LNAEGYTVAMTGAGSAGNETDYFGELTRQALAASQAANNISPAVGYFGPLTRSALNAELQMEEPANDEPANDEPANDEPADDDDEDEDDEEEYGREGTIDLDDRSTYRNVEVGMSQTKNVATYRVEAENSDVNIRRIDIYVINDDADDYDESLMEFRNDIDHLALKVDGDVVAETAINRTTIDRDDEYVRFGGLDIDVERDGYVDITIEVTASDEETPDSATYEIGPMEADSIRGVDSAGINIYTPSVSGIEFELTGEESGELDIAKNSSTPDEGVVVIDADELELVPLLIFDLEVGDSDLDLETLTVAIDGYSTFDGTVETIVLRPEEGDDFEQDAASSVDFDDLDMELESGNTYTFEVWADVKVADVDEQGDSLRASVRQSDNEGIAYDMSDNLIDLDGDVTGEYQGIYVISPMAELGDNDNAANTDGDKADAYMDLDVTAVAGDVYFLGDTAMVAVDETGSSSTGWDVVYDYSNLDSTQIGVVIVDASGDLVLDADDDVFDGTEVNTTATDTDSLNVDLRALGYATDDYVNVDDDSLTDGIYKVAASGGTAALQASYGTDTLYYLAEGETETVEIVAVNENDGAGWIRLEISEINWYVQDEDGAYYDFQFTDAMEDVDALETDQVNI
jgi:hypothetical protein